MTATRPSGTGRTILLTDGRRPIEDIGRPAASSGPGDRSYQLDDAREDQRGAGGSDPFLYPALPAPCGKGNWGRQNHPGGGAALRAVPLGRPAIEGVDGVMKINQALCAGCGLCEQLCPAGAIVSREGA